MSFGARLRGSVWKRLRRSIPREGLAFATVVAFALLTLVPGLAMAKDEQPAATKKWTLRGLQARHNRVLYKGIVNLTSELAPNKERIVGDNTDPWGMSWTKCTNIGVHMLSTLVAEKRGLITPARAKSLLRHDIGILARLKTHRGIFPENIKIKDGIEAEVIDGKMRFSSIDAAWVTVALSLVETRYRGADRDLARRAGELVARQDYTVFVGADGMLGAGFYVDVATDRKVEDIAFSYSDRNSEARPLVLALWSMGQLPASAWENTRYEWSEREGLPLAAGWHYSAFVEMTGALFFDEAKLAPQSLGLSHKNYLEANIRVAQRLGHKMYGYAPACDAKNAYAEFGLDRPDAVTPYAAALLTMTGDPRAYANFNQVLDVLPRDGSPLADGIEPTSGKVSCGVARILDQGLMFLALNADVVRGLVRQAPWYPAAEQHLKAMDRPFLVAERSATPEAPANDLNAAAGPILPATVVGTPQLGEAPQRSE